MLNVVTPKEALEMIQSSFVPLEKIEKVALEEARGRVLAEDVLAGEYVPSFNRSSVDGYAVRARDTFGCSDAIPAILPVSGETFMGEAAAAAIVPETAVAVPTGGAVPEGADAVVMVEYTEDYGDGSVGILKPVAPGQAMVYKGDDVCPDTLVLQKGRVLRAQDIGTLAAIGRSEVAVMKKVAVGVISTGDELVTPDKTPAVGQVRDVNSAMLRALLEENGAEVICYGIVVDDADLLRERVNEAMSACDVVLLSGGSSVGVKDATCQILEDAGELLFHGIAMKPGKPTILGKHGNQPLVGLPGHPVAAYFVTRVFVLPLLARLSEKEVPSYKMRARLTENVSANHGRAQYHFCRLHESEEGLVAEPIRAKSGLITTLAGTDGFFVIDRDQEGLAKGSEVEVILSMGE